MIFTVRTKVFGLFAQILTVAIFVAFTLPAHVEARGGKRPTPQIDRCAELLTGQYALTPEAVTALRNASEAFNIDYLVGEVGGKKRLIVLAGEAHIKGDEASKLGKELIAQFPFRGLEGAAMKSWAARIAWPIHSFARSIVTRVFKLRGSSIVDAHADTERQNAIRDIVAQHANAAKKVMGKDPVDWNADLNDEQRAGITEMFNEMKLSVTEVDEQGAEVSSEISSAELIKIFIELLGTPSGNQDSSRAEAIRLEAGHVPTIAENLQMFMLPYTLMALGVGLSTSYLPDSAYFTDQNLMLMLHAPIYYSLLGGLIDGTAGLLGFDRIKGARWFELVFPLETGLLVGRNRTMVRNVITAFEENPDRDHMLVIIGASHNPGMKRLLMKQHGFRDAIDEAQAAASRSLP